MSRINIRKKADLLFNYFCNDSNFRLVFLGSLLFASLNVIRIYFYVLAGLCMIWAAWLFGYKMIYKQRVLRVRNRWLIYIFSVCAFLTCILHLGSNFFVNVYYVCYMAVCFFFFYGIHADKSRQKCTREVCRILDFINIVTTVMMIAGLVLLAIFPKGFSFEGDAFAIHQNRFVGILFNANVTAFYALMALIACNLLWVIRQSSGTLTKKIKVLYIVCGVVNLFSLFLSDSNDSLLMLVVYLCFICFYVIFKGYKKGIVSIIFRIIALLLACIIVSAALLGTRTLVQEGVSNLLSLVSPHTQISTGVTAKPGGNVVIKPDDRPKSTTFEHQNTNLDSGRFKIWRQSMGLFKEFPMMGIGKANIVDYGKIYLGGLKYEDFHNGLITIAVSYGTVGLLIFMVFAITVAKAMLKTIFRYRSENRRDGRVLMYITAFCAAYCVYSMFEVALLVDISYRVVIFWLMVGLAMSYVRSYEHSALLAGENIPARSRTLHRIAAYNYRKQRIH